MEKHVEKARELPVVGRYDVIVAGGGVAGFAAAVASARRGSKTLVVERMNCLGGQMTSGIMGIFCAINDQEKIVIKGLPQEFFDKLYLQGGVKGADFSKTQFIDYDAEAAKSLINEYILAEPNLTVLYETWIAGAIVEGNKVCGIIVENKTGRSAYYAKCVVDATADADICYYAGGEYKQLPRENLHQVTLITKLAGIDKQKMFAYYEKHPTYTNNSPTSTWDPGIFHKFGITDELEGVKLSPELEYLRHWFMLIYETPRDGEMYLNMTGEIHVDGTKTEELSSALTISRKRISECIGVLKNVIPGFENAYIIATASMLGVRETRQIVGEYLLTEDDLHAYKRFDDAVCSMCAPIGAHTPDGKSAVFSNPGPGNSFDIPLRSLIPVHTDGLIVAGRCISATHFAMGATRIMPGSMAIGQGAGVAASLAVELKIEPRKIPAKKLQEALLAQGVNLEGLAHK
jgi:ribulose 1,5-bisphosphate synthetase/thiazole synthase